MTTKITTTRSPHVHLLQVTTVTTCGSYLITTHSIIKLVTVRAYVTNVLTFTAQLAQFRDLATLQLKPKSDIVMHRQQIQRLTLLFNCSVCSSRPNPVDAV